MDYSRKLLDKSNMAARAGTKVPTYDLYGEEHAERSRFWMHCETIASRSRLHRWEIKSHRHEDFFQILHIRGGTGEALFGGIVRRLTPWSVVVVPPGRAHGFRFSRDMDGLVVTFVASRLPALASANADTVFDSPRVFQLDAANPDGRYLAETLDRLGAALEPGGSPALAEAHLATALLMIRAALTANEAPQPSSDRRRLERLSALMTAHAREPWPVAFYADMLGVSPTHLNRIVSAAHGVSISGLLARHLVEEAQRLLVFTGLGVADISTSLGFSDPAYFSRFFSHHVRMTPRAYRQSEREKLAG
jgi:AraC family transcriptional activator of pobA